MSKDNVVVPHDPIKVRTDGAAGLPVWAKTMHGWAPGVFYKITSANDKSITLTKVDKP